MRDEALRIHGLDRVDLAIAEAVIKWETDAFGGPLYDPGFLVPLAHIVRRARLQGTAATPEAGSPE